MQVTETLSEGLKREFRVVVPADDLDTKVNARLDELKGTVRINGFRPGKVPVGHLKRLYGRSVMAEAIEAAVRDANAKIVVGQQPAPRDGAAGQAADRGSGDQGGGRGQGRPRLLGRDGSPAEDRAGGFQGHQARAARRRGDRCRDRRGDQDASPSRTGRSCRRARARKRSSATRSRSRSPARSTARRSRAAPGEDIAVVIGSKSFIPGLRGAARRHQGGREPHRQGAVPAELSEGRACRQGSRRSTSPRRSIEAPGERRRSTTTSPSSSAWSCSPSCARP